MHMILYYPLLIQRYFISEIFFSIVSSRVLFYVESVGDKSGNMHVSKILERQYKDTFLGHTCQKDI